LGVGFPSMFPRAGVKENGKLMKGPFFHASGSALMWQRVGDVYVNLANVMRVRFDRADEGEQSPVAIVDTVAGTTWRLPGAMKLLETLDGLTQPKDEG
jgi:hypothetical protein